MPATRRDLVTALAYAALFLGGAAVGLGLAAAVAPGSWGAQAVSVFVLPVAFAIGLQTWYGLALLGLLSRVVSRLRSPPPPLTRGAGAPGGSLPGSFVFVPISSGLGAVAGTVVGLLSTTDPLWLVILVYWSAGTIHGVLAWRLARAGVLLPPERG